MLPARLCLLFFQNTFKFSKYSLKNFHQSTYLVAIYVYDLYNVKTLQNISITSLKRTKPFKTKLNKYIYLVNKRALEHQSKLSIFHAICILCLKLVKYVRRATTFYGEEKQKFLQRHLVLERNEYNTKWIDFCSHTGCEK